MTFLFTDIEGSTWLLQALGDRYPEAFEAHRRLLREAIEATSGYEFETQGDGFFVAFQSATNALRAAVSAQQALLKYSWPRDMPLRVRMGLHTGHPTITASGYIGLDLHRTARICAAGHGGQVLLSQATRDVVADNSLPDVMLRDLGEHRLKDLAQPQRLFQVIVPDLPADFPPLKSLKVLPNNLPIHPTSFIGREREIAEVRRLLSTARLLTLTGAGGSGKTRLALQVAADVLGEFRDGVWLAELAALSDPTLVPHAIIAALGISEQPGRPLVETLRDYLGPRSLLLLLDNCEHLLSACAELADSLLRTCPNLRILATSRQAFGISGEYGYRVPSLALPDPKQRLSLETLVQCECIRLFIERAVAVVRDFTVTRHNSAAVVHLCRRLDGIPLAIELAAARVKVVSVDQIVKRLDDRFHLLTAGSRTALPRHQTLRATMDWSYDLLSEREQVLLHGLSVFAGGWTLEAAEAVCSADPLEASGCLDLLAQLVDKSLVVVEARGEDARYRLLETVRQYALEKLQESGAAREVRRKHGQWYLALAERAEPELVGRSPRVWLERLEAEHDNLRAALEWTRTAAGDAEAELAELRLAGALGWFWFLHGYWSEGREWQETALAKSMHVRSSVVLKPLGAATFLALRQADLQRTQALSERGLALSHALGDKEGIAFFLLTSGNVLLRRGENTRAMAVFEQCLTAAREGGVTWLIAGVLINLGTIALLRGDFKQATVLHAEALALSRDAGHSWLIANTLRRTGSMALHQGHHGQAAAFYCESLMLCREMGAKWDTQECLDGLAGVACALRDYGRAARLLGAAEGLRVILGSHRLPPDQISHDEHTASTRSGLGEAAFADAWAEGQAMVLEQAIDYAFNGHQDGSVADE